MAKTPKVKKREVSIHSRAARRGASPAPKDLAGRAKVEEAEYKPWLHNAQNAGVSKKKKNKTLTHQQRLRQQRAMEKADANVDKLEKKVADSKTRGKKVDSRRIDWEELNEKLEGRKRADEAKEAARKARKDGAMPGQDVVLPDMEQPLAIRSAEMSSAEDEAPAPLENTSTVQQQAVVLDPEEVDEVL